MFLDHRLLPVTHFIEAIVSGLASSLPLVCWPACYFMPIHPVFSVGPPMGPPFLSSSLGQLKAPIPPRRLQPKRLKRRRFRPMRFFITTSQAHSTIWFGQILSLTPTAEILQSGALAPIRRIGPRMRLWSRGIPNV